MEEQKLKVAWNGIRRLWDASQPSGQFHDLFVVPAGIRNFRTVLQTAKKQNQKADIEAGDPCSDETASLPELSITNDGLRSSGGTKSGDSHCKEMEQKIDHLIKIVESIDMRLENISQALSKR